MALLFASCITALLLNIFLKCLILYLVVSRRRGVYTAIFPQQAVKECQHKVINQRACLISGETFDTQCPSLKSVLEPVVEPKQSWNSSFASLIKVMKAHTKSAVLITERSFLYSSMQGFDDHRRTLPRDYSVFGEQIMGFKVHFGFIPNRIRVY